MRVAYDASPLLGPRTGIGHYAATLLERLLAIDASVTFDLFAITTKDDRSQIPEDPRVSLHRIPIPGRLGVTAWSALGAPRGDRFTGAADVVHGTNFWIPPLDRRNGVVTLHDLTFLLFPELCTPQIQRYRWIVPKVLESCRLAIVPSETVKGQVAELLSFDSERIRVTPEGVRNAFLGAKPDRELEDSIGLRGPYVLFAGTQEPRKNLDRLIEAMALVDIDGLQLVIAGPPGWGSIDLPAVAHKLKLDERVLFSGYLTDPQLGSLLAGAKAFVFPTLYEGFGLPPLEAMAAGVPVVASRAGAHPEVLGDAPFWCDPLDVTSIASAIVTAVSDETLRGTSIDKGRERAGTFTWDRTASLTLDVYREVAG